MPVDSDTSPVAVNEETRNDFSRQTLKRSSMLKHKIDIENLFRKGRKANIEYIKCTYITRRTEPSQGLVRIFVSAPKKYLHHAVDRNLMKRRMREAIRKNLAELRKAAAENNTDEGFACSDDGLYVLGSRENAFYSGIHIRNSLSLIVWRGQGFPARRGLRGGASRHGRRR